MVIDLDCSGLDISSSHPIFFGFHPIPLPSPSSFFSTNIKKVEDVQWT